MSAPAPAPPVTPSRTRLTRPRLLLAAAFAAVGFVAVWQGFGLAGFGTDVHTKRVTWACFQLLGFGLVLVCIKGWFPVRVLVALAFFGSACGAWWTVRSSNFKGAMSLREAVEERDSYRQQLATATVDNFEQHHGLKGIDRFTEEYPSLAKGLSADYGEWKGRMLHDIEARYNQTPPDDIKAVLALRTASKRLAEVHPSSVEPLDEARRQWLARAVKAKCDQLAGPPNVFKGEDWANFNRTAADRHTLAEAFPETRTALVKAEEEWAENAVTFRLAVTRIDPPDLPMREKCREWEKDLLALNALDTTDERFKEGRKRLFTIAHDSAKSEVTAHLDAGRYEAAFGLARKHAVEWNATAALLGAGELKQLDSLRETCEFFDKLAAKSVRPADAPDIAPPPRTKP